MITYILHNNTDVNSNFNWTN